MLRGKVIEGDLVGYARVSTAESLQMQIDAMVKAGVSHNHIHTEVVSGVAKKRLGLDAAIMDCNPGDTLVVWKLDRIGRSLSDLLARLKQLEDMGVGFVSLTEQIDTTTPGGRLIVHVMGALAQFERDLVVERTRTGVAAAKERGVRFGRLPKLNGKQRADALKLLRGGMSTKLVAKRFRVSRQTIYVMFPGNMRAVPAQKRPAKKAAKRRK